MEKCAACAGFACGRRGCTSRRRQQKQKAAMAAASAGRRNDQTLILGARVSGLTVASADREGFASAGWPTSSE